MPSIAPDSVHRTLGNHILADGLDLIFDSEKSQGAYLWDAKHNKKFLDLFSFFATQPIGFNHPKMVTPEFREQLAEASINRPTLSDIYTTEYAKFVETFARVAGAGHFRYYFFIEGGTLGVENALKVAFDWKVRKNLSFGRGEKGLQIIHFKEAFHGRSGYTLSLTNTFDPNKHQYFPKFSWPRITNPKLRFPVTPQVLYEVEALEKTAIGEIKQALSQHPDDIAALIIEPIQAEGGDNHFRPEFFRELRTLADENDFLLVLDEVQTGFGLTGKMWAYEHFGVKPDLIAFGKKAQIAGCASSTRVDDVKDNVFHVASRINSTWGGNLTDMIRCTKCLEIMEQENLVSNAAQVGEYFFKRLSDWANHTKVVSNVRGRGLMMAFDLPDSNIRSALRKAVFEHGAIMLACGPKSLRLRPHLDFTRDNVDQAIAIFEKAITAI